MLNVTKALSDVKTFFMPMHVFNECSVTTFMVFA